MAAKRIPFGEDVHAKIIKGVTALANAVKVTLDPRRKQ